VVNNIILILMRTTKLNVYFIMILLDCVGKKKQKKLPQQSK